MEADKNNELVGRFRLLFKDNRNPSVRYILKKLSQGDILLMARHGPIDVQLALIRTGLLRLTGIRDRDGKTLREIFAESDNATVRAKLAKMLRKVSKPEEEITARAKGTRDRSNLTEMEYDGWGDPRRRRYT